MGHIAISAEGLSKQYRIGGRLRGYRTLRETVTDAFAVPFRCAGKLLRLQPYAAAETHETIWALKDVSFDIKQGDVVGVVGRNGAGKTTLLKILSRITEPTEGYARIRGRVGSLLEVGTGFHPELTGRENIYLNGAILGMKKAEMDRKFDEIVTFAEMEKFIDTPVKHYSSGMYVRLAFAVAAHLEPEILLVDEVLAVGDAAFQKKCLGKMEDVSTEGRTVLFVSHNMAAIKHLCSSAIFLERGQVNCQDSTEVVVSQYLQSFSRVASFETSGLEHNEDLGLTLKRVDILDGDHHVVQALQTGSPVAFRLSVDTRDRYTNVLVSIGLNSSLDDVRVCVFHSRIAGYQLTLQPPQTTIFCIIPKVLLSPGRYRLSLKIMAGSQRLFYLPNLMNVDVVAGDFYGTGRLPDSWGGVCLIEHAWEAVSDEGVPTPRNAQSLDRDV